MFNLTIDPAVLAGIVAGILALAFDWMPKLAPWYDALSEHKTKQLLGVLLAATVGVIFAGLCQGFFINPNYTCAQQSLSELCLLALSVLTANQSAHALFKPIKK
jgi:hypothetical protein